MRLRVCVQCGFDAAPVEAGDGTPWPVLGSHVEGRRPILLEQTLPADEGARRFLGRDDEGARYEIFAVVGTDPQGALAARRRAHEALPLASFPPDRTVNAGALRFTVTHLPEGSERVPEIIARLAELDAADPVEIIKRFGVPVVRLFAELHDRGVFLSQQDPDELVVSGDRCRFLRPPEPHPVADGPVAPGLRRVPFGFGAPELHGLCGGRIDPRADVFFAGAVLYYLLARIPPLEEAGDAMDRLPSPTVYRDDLPPGVVAVVRRATSPVPARRYPDCRALRTALDIALASEDARRQAARRRLGLKLGHELHIGVLKGQYAPQNQDDLFVAYDARNGVGLFLVSDGVSISEHGSGDIASECVRIEAHRLWQDLPREEAGDGAPRPTLPAERDARRGLLQATLDRANARIGELIHRDMPRFPGPPEGIMAATAVAALLDGNRVTLCSIGDSRIYLIRDGHITSLLPYHDLCTQLIRMRRATPRVARAAPAAAALIRCVGEFEKDGDDRLVPVPLQPEFRELTLLPGDSLVLCSDGIPDYAGFDDEHAEARICQTVETAPGAPWAAFELMVLANRGGGGDNISCIVLRFEEQEGES
ncbi:MAG: protein phosphatase 2C domain-containing protein [Myxococcales bacterium]|nr:protein phosphatase 2C domain-containing protein [Myxococcales bacterium]